MTQSSMVNRPTAASPSPSDTRYLAVPLEMWGREGLETIKAQIAPGASDVELAVFAETCKRLRLDPFANQIWSIRRRTYNRDTRQYDERQVTQIGVHGLRLIAQRTREWGGRAGPLWLTADGEWVHVWLDDKPPRAARVGVKRRGNAEYTWSVAVWDRAAQVDKDGNPMSLWKTRGPEMLALAAERDALRSEFAAETTDLEVEIDPETARLNAAKYAQIYDPEREQARFDTETARASSRRSYTEIFEADDQARTDAQTRQANAAGRAIADQAHAAAATRDEDLDRLEAERQKRQEGLL